MEPVAIAYLTMFFVCLLIALILGKRIYITKNEKASDGYHFRLFSVMTIIVGLLFIIIPFSTDVKPVDKNSRIVTTKITKIEHHIITGKDTIYYYTEDKIVDTLSNTILPDSLKLDVTETYTVFRELFSKRIKQRE